MAYYELKKMIVYVTIILAFCLLQFMNEIYPRLHSIIYTIFIFLFLTYLAQAFVFPFVNEYLNAVPSIIQPVIKLLVFSVLLLFLSQILEELLVEYEYTSLATIITFTTKAILLLIWIQHMQPFFDKFFAIFGSLT